MIGDASGYEGDFSDNDLKTEYETYSDINAALANIKSEYYIIANDSLDDDFIEKAMLHYKYLDVRERFFDLFDHH